MNAKEKFEFWLHSSYFDHETKKELEKIKDNPDEIEERFYKDLEFGTAGLRGIMGAGTNRMNIYTIRKASAGVAEYVARNVENGIERGIVIAYDSRYNSRHFALEAAKVFGGRGIKAFVFESLRPTPELSFAVRHLKAAAGIVITASHNSCEYNGYKVYGEDGCQLPPAESFMVMECVNCIDDITGIEVPDENYLQEKGLMVYIGEEIDNIYIDRLKTLALNQDLSKKTGRSLKLVYTPLHGTGAILVPRILRETGFDNVSVVKEQASADPAFPTVKYPNPEDPAVYVLAIKQAEKEAANLIIATDPDCDRIGVAVKNPEGKFLVLTGNQTGCLLLEYILSQLKEKSMLPSNAFAVKTIVTTSMANTIAENYGVEMVEVLTGFKFIGEKIKELDDNGSMKFIFGFEESYGYLAGTFARDKDAVVTAMLVAEMAAYFHSMGKTLYDAMVDLYKKYGYYLEDVDSMTLAGASGSNIIQSIMGFLRKNKPAGFGPYEVLAVRDYLEGTRVLLRGGKEETLNLPASDVLYFEMADGGWFCIRPSGTEPKIKFYFGVKAESREKAKERLDGLKESVMGYINSFLEK